MIRWLKALDKGYDSASCDLKLASKCYANDGTLVTNSVEDMMLPRRGRSYSVGFAANIMGDHGSKLGSSMWAVLAYTDLPLRMPGMVYDED